MSAEVIDGRAAARSLKTGVASDLARLKDDGIGIGLATVVVGDEYSSAAYDRRLTRLATELGVAHRRCALPATASQDDVIALVEELDTDPAVSGILVLRPPRTSTRRRCSGRSTPARTSRRCTRPEFYHRSLIVVVGHSNNVGKPAISLAYERQATVESVDEWADRTTGLGRHTRWADVLIVAAGQAGLIKAEHVSENAIVIDVSINPQTGDDGRVHMVGDVDHASVTPRVRAITPVPGGVGPADPNPAPTSLPEAS